MQAAPARRKIVRDVRYRHVVRRLHVWSVLKVSVIFYICVLAVFLVAGAVLWDVASAAGIIHSVDKIVRSLFALSSFKLHPLTALGWSSAVIGGLCAIGVLLNVVAAVLYNLISDIVGGIEVTLVNDQGAQAARGTSAMSGGVTGRQDQRGVQGSGSVAGAAPSGGPGGATDGRRQPGMLPADGQMGPQAPRVPAPGTGQYR